MKFCFLQVSDNLLNPDDPKNPADVYFKAIWNHLDGEGYYKPEHFWEIPTWVAELSYCLNDQNNEFELWHITGNPPAILPKADIYFASVMDCNKKILQTVVKNNPNKTFYLGGYIGFDEYLKLFPKQGINNVRWYTSIKAFCGCLGTPYKYGTDYSLFKGMKCIPRLTLSNGCTNHCRFCTVPNKIIETDGRDISQQIESMRNLDFELIYINDKTFGQASNYWHLKYIYNSIAAWNPKFRGFTVQTTCQQIRKFWGKGINLKDLHIVNVEIGVESFNNEILQKYNKPQNTSSISIAIDMLEEWNVNIIPNIIIGLPGETEDTYWHTYHWVHKNRNKFLMLNVTNFVPYVGSNISDIVETQPEDLNQTICKRTYHTEEEAHTVEYFADNLFELGMVIIEATKARSK